MAKVEIACTELETTVEMPVHVHPDRIRGAALGRGIGGWGVGPRIASAHDLRPGQVVIHYTPKWDCLNLMLVRERPELAAWEAYGSWVQYPKLAVPPFARRDGDWRWKNATEEFFAVMEFDVKGGHIELYQAIAPDAGATEGES